MSSAAPGPSAPVGPTPPSSTPGAIHRGFVKQVVSCDALIIRGVPKGGPPPEKQLNIANIVAPRLARRPVEGQAQDIKEEPFAWEAREFLRAKTVGKEVTFVTHYAVPGSDRVYGALYLGSSTSGENLAESLLAQGFVELRNVSTKSQESDEYVQKLREAEGQAKAQGLGRWGADGKLQEHVRNITWAVENPRNLVDALHQKPQKAVIEHIRDGSTVRAFLYTPGSMDFTYVTLMLSGVKAPIIRLGAGGVIDEAEPFAEEAKYFTEVRLLQRDVEIVLESSSNQNFVGSILHPKGNIAELLLKEGYAKCVDWSIALAQSGTESLRAAEKDAKTAKRRIWKNYESAGGSGPKKAYTAKVVEVVNGDALMIRKDDGSVEKIWISSVRPPRMEEARPPRMQDGATNGVGPTPSIGVSKPLYEIPFMFEAREFLRKRLIGKKVQIHEDYIQAGNENFPSRTCCTVTSGGINVAEALIAKGLGTVVRYRQDNDARSSHYDTLLAAEAKAEKGEKGVWSLKNKEAGRGKAPNLRIQELTGDATKSKQFLPYLQRAGRSEGVVEFVASGSRMRIHVPKETCLITLLLSGISCPKADRSIRKAGSMIQDFQKGEDFGNEALAFTKDRCLQREVELEVEGMDKAGNFIGWMFVDGVNIAEKLVEEGLATVHFSAEYTKYFHLLKAAEDKAREAGKNLWKTLGEQLKQQQEERAQQDTADRSVKYRDVLITDVYKTLRFSVQFIDEGPKLEQMMTDLRAELASDPPLPGAYNPHRGDLCAAKFSMDNQWYRGRVEEINRTSNSAEILFVDFGNRERVEFKNLATLPSGFHTMTPGAREYSLALVNWPSDPDYASLSLNFLRQELSATDGKFSVNVEYRASGEFVTLIKTLPAPAAPATPAATSSTANGEGSEATETPVVPAGPPKIDIGRLVLENGLGLVDERKERRLQKLVTDYVAAQNEAKMKRLYIWEYGDFTGTDV